jgi:DNA-binding transcriptional MerR regulator
MTAAFTIGTLADRTGVKVTTIRYYESAGLLPEPPRSGGNRRLYGPRHVDILAFIRRCREFGLSFDAIRDLLTLEGHPGDPCAPVNEIAESAIAEIDRKIADLSDLKTRLRAIVDQCRGTRVETCAILKALHDPAAGTAH